MRFMIRFRIVNRWSKGSVYSIRELCISVVDRYSLKEHELATIFTLQVGESFQNGDLTIKRIK